MQKKVVCKIGNFPFLDQGHSHSHAHIVVPTNESVHLSHNGIDYELLPGYMSFVPPNAFHTFGSRREQNTIVMDIPEYMIKKSDLAVFSANMILRIDHQLMPVINLIQYEIGNDPDSDSVRYLFYYIYDKFIERHKFKSLKYINDNYSQDITVAQLAEIEHYNRFYYPDWFKQKTGFLPSEYIQNIRIEKSKILLANTRYKIIEIALQVGYDNNSSFTRVFKKAEGISPRQYRTLFYGKIL